jgi:hypothetical protein
MRSLLRKQVTITLQKEPQEVKVSGELVWFSDDGEVALRGETGFVTWSWPNLEAEVNEGGQPIPHPVNYCDDMAGPSGVGGPCTMPAGHQHHRDGIGGEWE